MDFVAGASFALPTPTERDLYLEHLAFQLTDAKYDGKLRQASVLIVTITSIKHDGRDDTTVQLDSNDHSYLNRPSCVCFNRARIAPLARLQQLDELGRLREYEQLDDTLFRRVCDGFLISPHTTPRLRAFFNKG